MPFVCTWVRAWAFPGSESHPGPRFPPPSRSWAWSPTRRRSGRGPTMRWRNVEPEIFNKLTSSRSNVTYTHFGGYLYVLVNIMIFFVFPVCLYLSPSFLFKICLFLSPISLSLFLTVFLVCLYLSVCLLFCLWKIELVPLCSSFECLPNICFLI